MIRVVLDTNIIVSALLQPLGPPAQVFSLAAGGSIQLCVSGEVHAKCEEVIRLPRFRRDESVITAALDTIREREAFGSSQRRPSGHVPIRMTTSFLNVLKPDGRPIW